MPLQVVRARERQPSTEDRFIEAFGETASKLGQAYFQNKSKKTKEEKEQRDFQAIQQLISDPDATDEQKLAGIYSALKDNPDMAKNLGAQLQGMSKQKQKANADLEKLDVQKKKNEISEKALNDRRNAIPKKTQASQPIDEDQMRRIREVREQPEYNEAPSPIKYKMLTDNGVSRENAKAESDIYSEQEKTNLEKEKSKEKNKQSKRKEQLQFHKESEEYDRELDKNTKTAKRQLEALGDVEKAISTGKVKPNSLANIFKNFGKIGHLFSEALLNEDEATLTASIPSLLEGWKDVFGVRLSDADLKVLQDKLPSIGKNEEANRAILKIMKKYGKVTLLRSKIASDIKKKNEGLRPLNYANLIEERYDEMVKPVKVVNPKTGKVIEIPAYELGDAINSGASLANE